MHSSYRVADTGEAESVIRASPQLAVEREPGHDGLIDIGELVGLDLPVRYADASEDAHVGDDLLLPTDTHSGSAGVAAYGGDVGRPSRDLREGDGIPEGSHGAPGADLIGPDTVRH